MNLIDFHAHFFPDEIAPVALGKLKHAAGNLNYFFDGTLQGLRQVMKENGVTKAVALNIAVKPNQQRTINSFAKSMTSEDIVCFGSVHPNALDALDEIDYIADMGLKGIKFHPEYQDFFVDDEQYFPMYEKIAEKGLITVFHAGRDLAFTDPCRCTPQGLAKALPHFGGAPVVAAHMGGYALTDEVEQFLVDKDIYFDTSFSYSRVIKPQAKRIIENHGFDKILFGTDLPWSSVEDEVGYIKSMEFSAEQEELIFYKNAERLLHMQR